MNEPAHSGVREMLRIEGAAAAVLMAAVAWHLGPPWWLVLLILAAPDLAMVAYARGPRVGAAVYNAAHGYVGPALLFALWLFTGSPITGAVAALWALHIGVDRALGYGLKYPTAFADTHLGRIGRS